MSAFVVLLRGVNVGGAKRVPMAEFREVLLSLGCRKVSTLLNSGNAVVEVSRTTSAALAKKVAKAMAEHFCFEVPVIVKSADELNSIVAANVLATGADDHSRLLVTFAQTSETFASLRTIQGLVSLPEQCLVTDQAAYLHCPDGILNSKAAAALLGKTGQSVTTRNWATVLKLQALTQ